MRTLLVVPALLVATPAWADTIEYIVRGTITDVEGTIDAEVGDAFVWSIAYDSHVEDIETGSNRIGLYELDGQGATSWSRLDVGGASFLSQERDLTITTNASASLSTTDRVTVSSTMSEGGSMSRGASLQLSGSRLFVDQAIPHLEQDWSTQTITLFRGADTDFTPSATATGTVTSIEQVRGPDVDTVADDIAIVIGELDAVGADLSGVSAHLSRDHDRLTGEHRDLAATQYVMRKEHASIATQLGAIAAKLDALDARLDAIEDAMPGN